MAANPTSTPHPWQQPAYNAHPARVTVHLPATNDAPHPVRAWRIDKEAVQVAAALLGLGRHPLVIKYTAGRRRIGSHRWRPRTAAHVIALSGRLDVAAANNTLWHELVHAAQVEAWADNQWPEYRLGGHYNPEGRYYYGRIYGGNNWLNAARYFGIDAYARRRHMYEEHADKIGATYGPAKPLCHPRGTVLRPWWQGTYTEEAGIMAAAKTAEKAKGRPAKPPAPLAEVEAAMEANRAGYEAYEQARRQLRDNPPEDAAELTRLEGVMADNRAALTVYWRGYNDPRVKAKRDKAREQRKAKAAKEAERKAVARAEREAARAAKAAAAEAEAQGGQG